MQHDVSITAPVEANSGPVWVRAPYGQSPLKQLLEFWRRRQLLKYLISFGLGRLYSKTFLGTAWLFIRPAIMIGSAVFVMGKMFGINTAPVPLVLFTMASFGPFLLFQRGILMGTRSFSMYKALLNRFLFPRTMVQIASIAPAMLIFLLVFAATLVLMIYFAVTGTYAIDIGVHMVWAPVAIILMMFLVWGLGFLVAPMTAMLADIRYTMRYLITVTMIISPVFYPMTILSEQSRSYMWYNPFACILELYRWGLFHQSEPSWWHVGLAAALILAIFSVGWWFFSWCEQRALDEV